MPCEDHKRALFEVLDRFAIDVVKKVISDYRQAKGPVLAEGQHLGQIPSPGIQDYDAVQALCLVAARYALCKVFALADKIDCVAEKGPFIRVVLEDGTDLSGDLMNEFQLYILGGDATQ